MKSSCLLLAVVALIIFVFLGVFIHLVSYSGNYPMAQPTQPTTPSIPNRPPNEPIIPIMPEVPKPLVKVQLLLFTQNNCVPCERLKEALQDPAIKEVVARFAYEEVKYPDSRFKKYNVTQTPTLIVLAPNNGPQTWPGGGTLGELANWLSERLPTEVIGKFTVGGAVGPDGQEIATDLPETLRMKNVGGRDGQGLCVFTSINHAALWQNEISLFEFQKVMRQELGGGWPDKVDKMIKKYGKGVVYVQYEGSDPTVLELALKTGRMPSVTYSGRDGVFYHGPIAHMVNLVYLDKSSAAILDNNNPTKILWMSRQEFLDRWSQGRSGWAVILLNPRPAYPPHNINRKAV